MAVISLKTLEKKCTKAQAMLVASLSKAKLDGMRAVSAVPIKYVAPAYKKPPYSGLSEDQWG